MRVQWMTKSINKTCFWAGAIVVLLTTQAVMAGDPPLKYPATPKEDVSEVLHGTKVSDPYRWLEEDVRQSKRVADWVAAENEVTFGYLERIPEREPIKKMLTKLWNYEKFSAPFKAGGRYYYFSNDGLQNHSVLQMMETLDSPPKVMLDPNTWSKDGTTALGGADFSEDGKYLAYGIQEAGSDWRTWRIMDVATKALLPDELKWLKFTDISWTKDSKGFFYARYEAPKEGETFQSLNLGQKIFYHRVGTAQSEDSLVYHRPDQPEWGYNLGVTEDGRYLVVTIWKGTADKYRVMYKDLTDPYGTMNDLVEHFEDEYSFIGNDDTTFFFKTDLNAPNKRVIAMDIKNPAKANFKEILPEGPDVIEGVGIVANMFVVETLHDAVTKVQMYDLMGQKVRDLKFPGLGSASGFGGKRTDTESFYSYSSFDVPPSIYRYNMLTDESTILRQSKVDFKADEYEVKQEFVPSKDGTKVPIFICCRKGIKLDGSNPTLLYAYGGFNISLTPRFSISRASWMKMGGVFVQANLRGGGEYGEAWHQGGMKSHKQNVFDDFQAVAEWLIANKYTSSPKLAIQGGSNGGLLVGACLVQRPDLYGACLPAVGVMDMLRFHKFTAGRFWVDEYGSADIADDFPALFKYSPYHNLKPGTAYPPTMITTADTDDRVVPGHSFKFAARLQETHKGPNPVLIRIETKAGHGSGKPTSMQIEELADEWAFLVKTLNFKPTITE